MPLFHSSESSSYNLFERPLNMPLRSNFSEADQSTASAIGVFLKSNKNNSSSVNNCSQISSSCDSAVDTSFNSNSPSELPMQNREQDRSKRFSKRYSQSFSNRASVNFESGWENYVDQAALIVGDALRSNPSSKDSTPRGSPASPAITITSRKNTDGCEVNFIFVKASPKKDQDSASDDSDPLTSNVSGITIRSAPSPTETDGTFSSVFSTSRSLKRLSNGATGLLKNKLDLFVSKGSTLEDDDFYQTTQYKRSKSVSSLKSKSQSAPELEGQTFDEFIGESKSSSSDFDETTRIINNFNNIETLIDDIDGRRLVREFMKKRCNEELLLYIEVVRTFKKIKAAQSKLTSNQQTDSNTDGTPVESPRVNNLISATNATSLSFEFLKMKEFQLVQNQFISIDSAHCINVDHSIRDKFSQLYKEFIAQEFNEKTARLMYDRFSECLDQLYITISLQFKNEIFPQFKRTDDYKELLLQKVLEKHDLDAFCPENTSIESLLSKLDMQECWKRFKKKKLETLGQIQNFTVDDYKKIGISKLGHLKRISKAVKDHFNRCEELKKSFTYSIFQTPTTPRE